MFKYVTAFFRGLYKILWAYPKICRYAKRKDKYPFEVRYAYIRKLVNVVFKSFKVEVDARNLEKLSFNDTYLFVCNHQGVMDALTLVYLFEKPMTFVSKVEAKKIPIIGKACEAIDVIFIDRENIRDAVKMVKTSKEYLNVGRNVAIFPEGTRTKDANYMTGDYKAGALKPAYETKKNMAVAAIDGSYKIFSKKYNKDLKVVVDVIEVLDYENYISKNTGDLAMEIQTKTNEKIRQIRKQ